MSKHAYELLVKYHLKMIERSDDIADKLYHTLQLAKIQKEHNKKH